MQLGEELFGIVHHKVMSSAQGYVVGGLPNAYDMLNVPEEDLYQQQHRDGNNILLIIFT